MFRCGGKGGGGLLWHRILGLGLVKSWAACYREAKNRWNRELQACSTAGVAELLVADP